MVLLNADGSRAEMSGNGIGCLAQAAVLRTGRGERSRRSRRHRRRPPRSSSIRPGATSAAPTWPPSSWARPTSVDDEPEWTGDEILRAARVDVGNPHLVLHARRRRPARRPRVLVAALGASANAAIPGGINVEVVTPADARPASA